MRLLKAQREALLKWVAEGLDSGEINKRAKKFKPPFEVSRAQVKKYRDTRQVKIEEIKQEDEYVALRTGLALRAERVKKLMRLAELLEGDLFAGKVWLDDVKAVGSGAAATIYEYEKFNSPEIEQYRAILDDIAREVGHRRAIVEVGWREQAKKDGYDPDAIEQTLADQFVAAMVAGRSPGRVSGGAGEAEEHG